MKWMKKWGYLILFLGTGAGYFAFVDHWQVYAEPMKYIQGWYTGVQDESLEPGGKDPGQKAPDAENSQNFAPEDFEGENGENGGVTAQGPGGEGQESSESGANSHVGTSENGGAGQDGFGGGAEPGEDGQGGFGDAAQQGNSPDGQEGADQDDLAGGGSGNENGQDSQGPKAVEYVTVEDDYFADAVFIGDSRTVGMFEYGGLEEISTFYASKGLTIYKLLDSAVASSPEGKITVEEALQQNQFAKIYLMVGINEMGTGTLEGFLEKYKEVVTRLKELQPDAVIYLQGIMKVTSKRSAQGDYINNEGIEARNEGIALLADDEKVFYLDVNPLICDDTGGMDPEYTYDGVHLKGKHIQIWKDYLKTHAISP